MKGYKLLLVFMSLAVFLTVTGVAMFGPLLVEMSLTFGISVPVAGQLVTVAAAAWGVTAIVAGPFSDAYGRKPVLLLGMCFLALGALGIGIAPSFSAATGFSVLVGMGGGMVPPTCIALAGDNSPAAARPMSIALLTMQPGMSSVLGVPAAAVLGDVAGWRSAFIALGLAQILTMAILFALVTHRPEDRTPLDLPGRLRRVAAFPVTWYIAGTNVLARIAWGVIIAFFPAYLIVTYGLSTAAVALPVAIVAVWATAAPLLGGRIGRCRNRLLYASILLLCAAVPAYGVFLLSWGVWGAVVMAGLFMLMVVPVTTVLSILCAETGGTSRGVLAGVISSSNWGGAAIGAAIGGLLVAQVGYDALSLLLVVMIFASGLLMAFKLDGRAVARARTYFSKD